MADTYEKDLAQKTSLTTSDFIRVVGSDNVSYKQGMTSVLDIFNLVFTSASDMDTKLASLPTTRTFTFFSGNNEVLTIFGTGASSVRGILTRPNSTVVDFTLWTGINPTKMYTFRMTLATHEITYQTEWPTRAEVDALKNNQQRYANLTVNSGYVTIPITGMTATSSVICTLERSATTVGQMLIAYPQPSTNNLIVYVRKADGSSPTDGTTITISVRWI